MNTATNTRSAANIAIALRCIDEQIAARLDALNAQPRITRIQANEVAIMRQQRAEVAQGLW